MAGFALEVYELRKEVNSLGQDISFMEAVLLIFQGSDSNNTTQVTNVETATSGDQSDTKDDNKAVTEEVVKDTEKSDTITDEPTSRQDPWSLELFNATNPNFQSNFGTGTAKSGKIQIISQPTAKGLEPKITRSLSQPHVNTSPYLRYRSGLFNRYRKPSVKKPETHEDTQYASDFYVYSLIWACIVMLFWKNTMLLPILPIPILIYLIKHVGLYLGIWGTVYNYSCKVREVVVFWCSERADALLPAPIRGLYKATQKVNVTLKNAIKDSIDTVASCVVITALIVFVVCASIFIVFQVMFVVIISLLTTKHLLYQVYNKVTGFLNFIYTQWKIKQQIFQKHLISLHEINFQTM